MKNKTLSRTICTFGLLALIGCSSAKTASQTENQNIDLTVSDLLVERIISQAATEARLLAEAAAVILGENASKEATALLLAEISTLAKARGYGVNARPLQSISDISSAFSKAEAADLVKALGQEAKYALRLRSEAGQKVMAQAQSYAKESQTVGNPNEVVGIDPVTNKLAISESMNGYAQTMNANLGKSNPTMARRLVKANAMIYNNTRGLLYSQKGSCTISYDNIALENKTQILEAVAAESNLVKGKSRSCAATRLALKFKDGLQKLNHTFQNSVERTLTKGEEIVQKVCNSCFECPVNTPTLLMQARVANGGTYPTAEAACSLNL